MISAENKPDFKLLQPISHHNRWALWRYLWILWIQMVIFSLQWHHDEHYGVSNHQCLHCLLNRLFRRKSKKTSQLKVTGLCMGPVTWKMFPFDDVIILTHWGRDKMAVMLQMTFSNLFSCMKIMAWYQTLPVQRWPKLLKHTQASYNIFPSANSIWILFSQLADVMTDVSQLAYQLGVWKRCLSVCVMYVKHISPPSILHRLQPDLDKHDLGRGR